VAKIFTFKSDYLKTRPRWTRTTKQRVFQSFWWVKQNRKWWLDGRAVACM